MDIVIPVGPDCEPELRFCLRSIAAHLPHESLWLVGDIPVWAKGAKAIPLDAPGGKHARTKANLRAACEHPDISDPFLLFNDDFFVMAPVEEVPVLHAGYLANAYAKVHANVGRSEYARAMHQTGILLQELGVIDALSYDLHAPMPIDKALMLRVLELCVDNPRLLERTLYGNLAGLGGTQVGDMKVYTREYQSADGIAAPFVSTSDRAFGLFPIGRAIRAAFPDESAYERPPAAAPNSGGGRSRKPSKASAQKKFEAGPISGYGAARDWLLATPVAEPEAVEVVGDDLG